LPAAKLKTIFERMASATLPLRVRAQPEMRKFIKIATSLAVLKLSVVYPARIAHLPDAFRQEAFGEFHCRRKNVRA
jgi:hypothetical protein